MTSIFQLDVMAQQASHDNEATKELAKKQKTIKEATKELTNIFHSIHKDQSNGEPNWNVLLNNAKDSTEKMRIRSAREQWQEDQKIRAFEARQAEFTSRVDRLLATPQHQRNKEFYEQIKKTDLNAWWDSRVQKQRQIDRETLKLAFHLRAK